MPLAPGTRLGPYEVVAGIGAGGMGEVYKARDTRLQRDVAIKVVRQDVGHDPERLRRFEQEARAASALNHPNIISIYDVGASGATSYIAMEWVEGDSLSSVLERGHMPLDRALQVARQLSDALAKAHTAGIVHRDLKPANVMLNVDGFVKILDFGLAKLQPPIAATSDETAAHSGTRLGMVMGSPGYMSPEQALGRPVDHRADQFALGVILYEMFGGRHPFLRATAAQSISATLEFEPEPLGSVAPDLPLHLSAIVRRCLAKDPVQRYDSTRDLARDLRDLSNAGSLGSPRSGMGAAPRLPGPLISALGAAALILLGAGGAWHWRTSSPAVATSDLPLVAILPFHAQTADGAQDVFADGITEEIRGQLGKLSSLRLLSRSATESSRVVDLARLSADHGVGSVIEGRVRREGARVRIAIELVSTTSQQTLWSEQYDGTLGDVFAAQSDIAMRVAEALRARISPEERTRVERQPTSNLKAYDLYLQAQSQRGDRESNREAVRLLQSAIALDPDFALARARLAYRTIFLAYEEGRALFEEAVRLAQDAVNTDPFLADGHFALGSALTTTGKTRDARASFLRALELAPSHAGAMANLSILEANNGRYDESLYWARRCFAVTGKRSNDYYHLLVPYLVVADALSARRAIEAAERKFPESPRLQILFAGYEYQHGDTNAAVGRLRRLFAREPTNSEVRIALADLAWFAGAPDAISLTEQELPAGPDRVPGGEFVMESMRTRLAFSLQQSGQEDRARALLREAESAAAHLPDDHPANAVERAAVYALTGDGERLFATLEQVTEPIYEMLLLDRHPIFASFRADVRFQRILARVRRTLDEQRLRVAERGLLDLTTLTGAL